MGQGRCLQTHTRTVDTTETLCLQKPQTLVDMVDMATEPQTPCLQNTQTIVDMVDMAANHCVYRSGPSEKIMGDLAQPPRGQTESNCVYTCLPMLEETPRQTQNKCELNRERAVAPIDSGMVLLGAADMHRPTSPSKSMAIEYAGRLLLMASLPCSKPCRSPW